MDWITSVTLLFSALCHLSVCVPHQYYFVNENKIWNEAQRYCREKYTDLVTINNMEEMKNLTGTLNGKTTGSIWTGLQRGGDGGWQWSLKEPQYQTYSNWCSNNPHHQLESFETCGQMWKSGCWTDQDCVSLNPFVCYDETKAHQERYILITEKKSWCNAQRYCRENHTDLVSVRNQSDNQQIQNVIPSNTEPVWIGLLRNIWTWSDGSDSCFRNWRPTQPGLTEDCVTLLIDQSSMGQWDDWFCNTTFPFVCQKSKIVLIKQNLTWTEALRYCRQNRMDLVSVHTEEIQHWVMEVSGKASTEHVWLGLRYTCVQHFWFWVSGSSVCYENWAPQYGTGLEDCVYGDRTGALQSGGGQQWVSLNENQRLNFICTRYEDEN